ncbi:hypothetical protein G4Y79_22765 [Phototrophicus methaneseepsis]|uniref:Uncharacterized protein n=1 Tax=Phototrophicus methaneseepsis TaxID=2710758 RepID=A0A7S8E910_9CHLR|nr:hypothetical protein [Phototrophicus methaneseepsis]QPC82474.1 hypothetical protein G4Y79_22765 [Phototrophicus methaneseepsis]
MTLFARRFIVSIILLIALSGAALAQEGEALSETPPLFDLLATVPELAPDDLGLIYYADVAVAERARMGNANMITTAEQFEQLDSTRMNRVWLMGYPSSTALPALQYFVQGMSLYKETMGFELFDIEQSLYFGNPPQQGFVLRGDFDQEAIVAAFTARDYEVHVEDDLTVLCGDVGCENGNEMDLGNRNLGNMFGGEFGMSEPAALADGLIFNSRDFDRLNAMIDAYVGDEVSILTHEAYAASARAITQTGELRQAIFVPSSLLPQMADVASSILGASADEGQIAALEERLGLNDRDPDDVLPNYEVMTLADVTMPDEGVSHTMVTFAYNNPGFAATAVDVLQARLDNFGELQSLVTERPFEMLFEDRNASPLPVTRYTDEETGYEIVMVAWETPLVVGPQEMNGSMMMSGLTYRLLVDMLYQRDMAWAAAG